MSGKDTSTTPTTHHDPNKSLSDCLASAGFGHRRNAQTETTGRREVFDIATGEILGCFTALQASEWLKKRDAAG